MKINLLTKGRKVVLLSISLLLLVLLFMTYHTYGNWQFAWQIRHQKIIAFLLVGIATSFATISFQTITQSHFLTPNILGLDSLYVLIQTVFFFVVGGVTMLSQTGNGMFLGTIGLMTLISWLLARLLLKHSQTDLFFLLMIGLVAGTLFSSISTFLQVLMDPNEYDLLQGKLFASFSNIPGQQLLIGGSIILVVASLLFYFAPYLDILHLGYDQSINLGLSVIQAQTLVLVGVSILTAVATALVGPVTFLGFIVANLSYQYIDTFRHRWLFIVGSLVGGILLVGGQFLVEQVFQLKTTISVVIQLVGGLYFIGKIIRERSRFH